MTEARLEPWGGREPLGASGIRPSPYSSQRHHGMLSDSRPQEALCFAGVHDSQQVTVKAGEGAGEKLQAMFSLKFLCAEM